MKGSESKKRDGPELKELAGFIAALVDRRGIWDQCGWQAAYRWHMVKWFGSTSVQRGSALEQTSIALGQRG